MKNFELPLGKKRNITHTQEKEKKRKKKKRQKYKEKTWKNRPKAGYFSSKVQCHVFLSDDINFRGTTIFVAERGAKFSCPVSKNSAK